jgi:hypothetical protein
MNKRGREFAGCLEINQSIFIITDFWLQTFDGSRHLYLAISVAHPEDDVSLMEWGQHASQMGGGCTCTYLHNPVATCWKGTPTRIRRKCAFQTFSSSSETRQLSSTQQRARVGALGGPSIL